MTNSTLDQIRQLLDQHGIAYREVEHAPTTTSEASAQARGEPLEIGGKALVLKVDQMFGLFVFSAARRLDSDAVRRHFGAKKCRFATPEELGTLTGLSPGSVPPFGAPVLSLPLFVDNSILENDWIAFNAGSLTRSVIMSVKDYLCIATPSVFSFSR